MRKVVGAILACLLLAGTTSMAQEVTVNGYGTTQNEAERDAMRNGVEQVAGSLVNSETDTHNFELVRDEIHTTTGGYVKNCRVINSFQNADGMYQVTAVVDVDTQPDSKLMSKLMQHKVADVNMRDAKIAVMIPEMHLRYRIPDPAGETAVVKKFLEAGFQNMIDMSNRRYNYNQPQYMNQEQLRDLAQSMQADILVVGEAFSEGAGDVAQFLPKQRYRRPNTGIVSCRARVEAKMYIARTGQIIAADGAYGSGADITESIASKKALAQAGAKMGDYLVGQLMNNYSGNRQAFEVVVIANSVNDINRVKNVLGTLPGVNGVNFNNYANGRGVLSIKYTGSAPNLFELLQRNTDMDLDLESSSFNAMTVRVR